MIEKRVMTVTGWDYNWYSAFLCKAKSVSTIHTFSGWNGEEPGVLLRHDVDFDVPLADRMAEVEREQGIVSSFFFMVSSPFYNICTKSSREILARMASDGFEVGLHFDPSVYGNLSDAELSDKARFEAGVLEDITGVAVKTVSIHCPSVLGCFPEIHGFRSTYDKAVFSDESYVSDSSMSFRGKDPMLWVDKARDSIIQFLFHPMHYSNDQKSYMQVFGARLEADISFVEEYFRVMPVFDTESRRQNLLSRMCSEANAQRGSKG